MASWVKRQWHRWRAFKTNELVDELRAEDSQKQEHLRDPAETADPKLSRISGARDGWQGLSLRPAKTDWRGD